MKYAQPLFRQRRNGEARRESRAASQETFSLFETMILPRGRAAHHLTVHLLVESGGAPADLEVVRSSGYPELDQASLETFRRAGPYPAIHGRLRTPCAYRLDR